MNSRNTLPHGALVVLLALASCQPIRVPDTAVNDAFSGREGSLIIVDCSTGSTTDYRPKHSAERLPPCSTFKIWNTLVGVESGAISSPDEMFYRWDGVARTIPEWNKDLTLRDAFRVSCVPAFQNLARRIGVQRMQYWIDAIGYGDRDTSAGIDVFWLPAQGRKTLLITPQDQARLMYELVSGRLAFSSGARAVLRDIMRTKETTSGVLYGKTGSGTLGDETHRLGWYVGYVESKRGTYSFACTVKGKDVAGRDARAIVETVFTRQGLL